MHPPQVHSWNHCSPTAYFRCECFLNHPFESEWLTSHPLTLNTSKHASQEQRHYPAAEIEYPYIQISPTVLRHVFTETFSPHRRCVWFSCLFLSWVALAFSKRTGPSQKALNLGWPETASWLFSGCALRGGRRATFGRNAGSKAVSTAVCPTVGGANKSEFSFKQGA